MAATPNCQLIESAVLRQFKDARFGRHNCRKISGSGTWSQHAASEPGRSYYGNALDITHARWGYSSNPIHQAWLLRVKSFIKKTFPDTVRVLLGPGNKNHSNHVHVDPWPKMQNDHHYVPPCKGGTLVVIHKSGRKANTYGPPPPPPPPSMEDNVIQRGDEGRAVVHYQESLEGWDANSLPVWGADGDFGAETEAAVKSFQGWLEVDQNGVIDGVIADSLSRFHPVVAKSLTHPNQPHTPVDHSHDDGAHGHSEYALTKHPHTVPAQTI